MIKRLLILLASSALAASASTITFQPNAQTISLGGTATVDVNVSGLTARQVLGAFDLLVLNDASIITPTSVTFFSSLGAPSSEFTSSPLTAGSANGAEVSLESTMALLDLQSIQPFSLFAITYKGIGAGTSMLTLGSTPDILSDGSGFVLPDPTVTAGSITVLGKGGGGGGGMSPTPEPSTFALLGSGGSILLYSLRRRRIA